MVVPSALDWFGAPWRRGEGARFAYSEEMPEVLILPAFAGMEPAITERLLTSETRAVVVSGLGEGNMPDGVRQRLIAFAQNGGIVARASRSEQAIVNREPEDDENGFVAARALNPQKARILLQVLLANGVRDAAAIQAAFDSR
jgi:L-asparaginase